MIQRGNGMKKGFYVPVLCLFMAACGRGDIASVNGHGVSSEEFDAYLEYKRVAVRNDQHRQHVLDQYLERAALAEVIAGQGLSDDPVLQAELEDLRREVLISRYFQKYLNEKVTDQVVADYYNNHADDYQEKKAHVAHILLRTNSAMDEAQRKAKLTTAQEAYSKIQAGMDFSEAARAYSEDEISAKKDGDLGWVKEGTIGQAFSEKAFSLKAGQVSEPFETPFGYHVLKVLEEPKVIRRPLESVKGEIRYQLRNQYKEAEMKRLLSDVKIKKH